MRTTILFLCAVMACASLASAQTNVDRSDDTRFAQKYKEANAAIPRAREAMAKKDYARAKTEAAAVLAKMPEFSEANFILAKIAYIEKDYPAALGYIESAKSTFDKTASLTSRMEQERLSQMRKRRDEQDRSISEMNAQLSRTPQDQQQELRSKIQRAESIRGDLDRALNDAAARTDQHTSPPEYFFFHGNILLRMNKPAEAVEQYTEALRLNPGYAEAGNNLASVYLVGRQPDKALSVLEQVEAKGGTVNPELKKAVLQALGRS